MKSLGDTWVFTWNQCKVNAASEIWRSRVLPCLLDCARVCVCTLCKWARPDVVTAITRLSSSHNSLTFQTENHHPRFRGTATTHWHGAWSDLQLSMQQCQVFTVGKENDHKQGGQLNPGAGEQTASLLAEPYHQGHSVTERDLNKPQQLPLQKMLPFFWLWRSRNGTS